MTIQHKNIRERWNQMRIDEQMGNIGSDVERAISWKKKGNLEYANSAFERALELFDLTLQCPANQGRRKEPARAREVFVDYFWGDNEYGSTEESLTQYFLQFALSARRRILAAREAAKALESTK